MLKCPYVNISTSYSLGKSKHYNMQVCNVSIVNLLKACLKSKCLSIVYTYKRSLMCSGLHLPFVQSNILATRKEESIAISLHKMCLYFVLSILEGYPWIRSHILFYWYSR